LLFHSADERSAVERFFSLFAEFINQEKVRKFDEKWVESGRML
jgi:hypothetical protein